MSKRMETFELLGGPRDGEVLVVGPESEVYRNGVLVVEKHGVRAGMYALHRRMRKDAILLAWCPAVMVNGFRLDWLPPYR